MQKYARVEVFF